MGFFLCLCKNSQSWSRGISHHSSALLRGLRSADEFIIEYLVLYKKFSELLVSLFFLTKSKWYCYPEIFKYNNNYMVLLNQDDFGKNSNTLICKILF